MHVVTDWLVDQSELHPRRHGIKLLHARAACRNRHPWLAYAGRERAWDRWLSAAPAAGSRGGRVVADAPAWLQAAVRKPGKSASAAVVSRSAPGALTAATAVLTGRVVPVVSQTEEPDQPDDEQAHVQHAEPHHEDPPFRAHASMIDRCARSENPLCELRLSRRPAGVSRPRGRALRRAWDGCPERR